MRMKVKRAIGIEIGSSHLCAVQIMRIGKAFCIEKVFKTQLRRSTDSPSDILKAKMSEYGFSRRLHVRYGRHRDCRVATGTGIGDATVLDRLGFERARDHQVQAAGKSP